MTKLIALDDGHGMETPGKRTPKFSDGTFMKENEFNRRVVALLDIELKRCGFRTVLVAPGDTDVPLATRVKTANNAKADFYLSVHANANTGSWGSWGGIETLTWGSGESLRIGKILHKYLMQGTKLRDRGMKDGRWLYVVANTTMPAALVECGFMDNMEEAKLLMSEAYRKECAIELAKGLCEAYGVKYVAGGSTPTTPTNPTKPTTPAVTGEFYTIKKGDTFWGISQQTKVSVDQLKKLNPTVVPEKLQVGAKIRIKAAPSYKTHTIQKGDTLWDLSREFRTTVGAIQSINPGLNPSKLQIGQKINIPG